MRTAPCSIQLDSGKSWLNCAIKRAISRILIQRKGAEEAWLPWLPCTLDRFVGFIIKIRHIGTIFMFSSGVSVVSRLEKSLSPITRATVVIFAELNLVPRVLSYPPYERERAGRREPWERGCAVLGFSVSFTFCHLLMVFFSVTSRRRRNADICALNVTEKGRQIQICLKSLSGWKSESG